MILSKVRESGFLITPGVLQRRQNLCCLACGIMDAGVNEDFMIYLLESNLLLKTVENVVELLSVFPMPEEYYNLSKSAKTAIKTVALNLLDFYCGKVGAPSMHPSYYQNHTMELGFSLNDGHVALGEITRGNVLEIFQDSENSDITASILGRLEMDATKMNPPNSKQYANLPYIKKDTSLNVSMKDLVLTVSQTRGNSITSYSYDLKDGTRDYDSLFDQMFRHIFLMESVSVVIVNTCNANVPGVPSVIEWLNFLKLMYGTLDSIIVVFVISYPDFIREEGGEGKSELRALINAGTGKDFSGEILWLDVFEDKERSLYFSDHPNLILNRFNKK